MTKTNNDNTEYLQKYYVGRGFNKTEDEIFGQIYGEGVHFDTVNDIDYQKRLFTLIESIIHNNTLDYLSKLHKIYWLTESNKSLNDLMDKANEWSRNNP